MAKEIKLPEKLKAIIVDTENVFIVRIATEPRTTDTGIANIICQGIDRENKDYVIRLANRFAYCWNAFEEGGLVEKLVGACEAYKRHCELHDSSEHPKANMFCTECPRYRKQIKEALVEANTK